MIASTSERTWIHSTERGPLEHLLGAGVQLEPGR